MRTALRLSAAALLGAATVVAVATPAQAAESGHVTVGVDGNMHYVAETGVYNHLTVTKVGTTVTLDDTSDITFTGVCVYPVAADHTIVDCTSALSPDVEIELEDLSDTLTISGNQAKWLVNLGDGNDSVDFTGSGSSGNVALGGNGSDRFYSGPENEWFRGGPGTDTVDYSHFPAGVVADLTDGASDSDEFEDIENLTGTEFDDQLYGDGGVNRLDGLAGDDELYGQGGNDTIVGGLDTDRVDGGTGVDTASYVGHPAGVTVTLDGLQNDGMPGENDSVEPDIENVTGSVYSDSLTGNAQPNKLIGDSCVIVCIGGGADTLRGEGGADDLFGGPGNDHLYGGAAYDTLSGGAGNGDWCYTESGGGTKTGCEWPLVIIPL